MTFKKLSAAQLFQDGGLLHDSANIPSYMQLFVSQSDVVLAEVARLVDEKSMSSDEAQKFTKFLVQIGKTVMTHPVVSNNQYLMRFSQGPTQSQARHELQQFAVFGVQFDLAQLQLMINSRTEHEYIQRWQLLMNELGCPYKDGSAFEGELLGKVNYKSNHKTWLRDDAQDLGLEFKDVGQSYNALEGTRNLVDATFKHYASIEPNEAASAALAIETWAGNFLWKPWIAGVEALSKKTGKNFRMTYMKYHNLEEEHHSQDVLSNALDNFQQSWFDENKYLQGVRIMLDAIQGYYESQLKHLPDRDHTWPEIACPAR